MHRVVWVRSQVGVDDPNVCPFNFGPQSFTYGGVCKIGTDVVGWVQFAGAGSPVFVVGKNSRARVSVETSTGSLLGYGYKLKRMFDNSVSFCSVSPCFQVVSLQTHFQLFIRRTSNCLFGDVDVVYHVCLVIARSPSP
jgi:hypothetical protein